MGLLSPISTLLRAAESAASTVSLMREDIAAVKDNDPAARGPLEVALVYPGLHALWLHRAAHSLWTHGSPFSARLLAHANRFATGIEIHPGATIGRRVVIDHGMGVVIGETAKIGNGCLLYKGVVLGGTSFSRGKRHPTLGENVVVGSNACVLGAIEIGDGARIGSGSVVVRPVPAEATVVGVPARIISPAGHRADAALDHANLPDPVTEMFRAVITQNEKLRERIQRLEDRLGLPHEGESGTFLLPYEGEELPPADGG